MFDPVSNKIEFPQLERDLLEAWEREDIFARSLEQREGAESFVFYDGPPFATGLPHYGHLLAGTIKDIVPRYQTMRGKYVPRRFGWDCHGLPIEALAQEALGLAGTAAIVEAGVDTFNEQCRSMVQTYVGEWRKTVTRMGRWVDFDNDYKTMDTPFMESIWWVFKQLWEQDRIYKAHRIMPYSWKLTTPLSNFEANRNYQDVQDPAVTVRLRLKDYPLGEPAALLIWTTTPWTLPANLAACVGPDIDYVAVKDADSDEIFVLAEARLSAYYKKPEHYEVLERYKGSDLAGWVYHPLFDYYSGHPNAFQVLVDDYVTTGDGTGVVHMAPAYGEDDYRVCRAADIELVDPLDADARFMEPVRPWVGEFCKDADKPIIRDLKDRGLLVHQSTIMHAYPFCERTDTPLIYRAIDAWYVKVEDLNERMQAHNDEVHWMPGHVGGKRFGNWLRDAKDWNISRNRFWGSCIPLWVSEDGEDTLCVGSIDELEQLSGVRVDDLHKHIVDEVTFEKDGKTYRRTPEVLDCWFESGAMPYAQQHYPFDNPEGFSDLFPADFIAEGLDQTRGWFYTLTILGTLLFDQPAFRNVIVNGLILAEDGTKMSKRKKNYPDPNEVIELHGADALRLYLIDSPVVRAEDLCFSEEGVKLVVRSLLIPWWNAYSFFVTYANVDGWTPEQDPGTSDRLLDQWILSSLERLTGEVTTAMDDYDLQASVKPFTDFVDDLTNWYIRRSRRRFWKSDDDEDKAFAYRTLYEVLVRMSQIAAPFLPFISDAIYRNLRKPGQPDSVHLCDFPVANPAGRDHDLEARMELAKQVVNMGRNLRTEHKLKVRQPLQNLHVATHRDDLVEHMGDVADLIKDELNVKAVHFLHNQEELAHVVTKANFRTLGRRCGSAMKAVAAAVTRLGDDSVSTLLEGNGIRLEVEGVSFDLSPEDVLIEYEPRDGLAVAAEGELVVALDTTLTDELVAEGRARELVNRLQQLRKTRELDVSDRIAVSISGQPEVQVVIETHRGWIMQETLALELNWVETLADAEELDLNGLAASMDLRKV